MSKNAFNSASANRFVRPSSIKARRGALFVIAVPGHEYDILSAYPVLGHSRGKLAPEKIRMAMAVQGKNRHYRWKEICARHWLETAKRCGLGEMKSIMEEVVARTPDVVQQVSSRLPAEFSTPIAETILEGIKASSRQLAVELATSR